MLTRVVFEMASPLVISDPLHLDAIIMAVHPEAAETALVRTMDANEKFTPIQLPLERAGIDGDWVWCASAAFFPDTAKPYSGKYCRHKDALDGDWLKKNVMTVGGLYKIRVAGITGITTPEVCFLAATEQQEELLALCERVRGLGRLRNHGYGMIKKVRLEPVTRDWRDVLVYGGEAMRTLPHSFVTNPCHQQIRTQPPYWARTDRMKGVEPGDTAKLSSEVALC